MRVAESMLPVPKREPSKTSMGPQHESCGKSVIDQYVARAVSLQWGRNMRVAESRPVGGHTRARRETSMGPQHESCGKYVGTVDIVIAVQLQWGRNMRVAESVNEAWIAACGA